MIAKSQLINEKMQRIFLRFFSFTAVVCSCCINTYAQEPSGWSDATKAFRGVWGIGFNYRETNYTSEANTVGIAPYIFGGVGRLTKYITSSLFLIVMLVAYVPAVARAEWVLETVRPSSLYQLPGR